MELKGKVAVITGAAQGIGFSCAKLFIEHGCCVVMADIDAELGRKSQKELGDSALFVETDVRSLKSVQSMVGKGVKKFGGIDILVNNAAVALNGVVDEIDEERWQTVIDTNLTGYWRLMKACIPHMRKKKEGAIVNISSVQGLRAFKGWPAYAAAKGAVNALTIQTAADLAPAGIRVNAVAPGTIMTPLNEKIFASMDDPSELIETWNRAHPIGRFGYPNEVAEMVVFLASPRASFITGEIVRTDGGLAIKGD